MGLYKADHSAVKGKGTRNYSTLPVTGTFDKLWLNNLTSKRRDLTSR